MAVRLWSAWFDRNSAKEDSVAISTPKFQSDAAQRAMEDVPQEDQARFIEVVETEVMSLHEGNIARYRLRPAEYQRWLECWH